MLLSGELMIGSQAFVFNYTFSTTSTPSSLVSLLTAAGWSGYSPVVVTLTIPNGVIVGSNSNTIHALTVESSFITGSSVTLNIASGGYLVGCGGAGAVGYQYTTGGVGGSALSLAYPITIVNNGVIAGGGGGGGTGYTGYAGNLTGGGGAGYLGGAGGYNYGYWGNPGTLTAGGAASDSNSGSGGGLGQPGGNSTYLSVGGAGGNWVDGHSYITSLTGTGSQLGAYS
jgi:hypothetical protein